MTRRKSPVALLAACLAIAAPALGACGGSDDSTSDEEARQIYEDVAAAFADEDYETVCNLSSERINEALPELMKTKTCPQAYVEIFKSPGREKFNRFVEQIQKYEPGDVVFDEEVDRTKVTLNGPDDKTAYSYLIDENGELKVSDLFVVPEKLGDNAIVPGG